MYLESAFIKYHSNVLGSVTQSAHPDFIELPDGRKIDVGSDIREKVLEDDWDKSQYAVNPTKYPSKYHKICDDVEFYIYRQWDNDANTSGSRIRWRVPKGSKMIFSE